MPTFHLTLLGRPSLAGPAGPVPIPVRKAQALLFFLAATGRSFSRSHLAGLLWEDSPEPDALRNLRLTLHRLRAALPVDPLRAERDALAWDAVAGVQVDSAALHDLLGRGHAADLAAAVALRQGPFLQGFELPDSPGFSHWLTSERQRWDERVLGALQRLVALAEKARTWQLAADYARQALAIDPLAEHFHRRLMCAHYQGGERAAALAAFAACEAILRSELGVAPDRATLALADDMRAERIPLLAVPGRAQVAPLPVPPRQPAPGLLPLVGRQAELAAAQGAILESYAGQRRLLLLAGDAGMGKSRLLEELMAGSVPGMFLVAQCRESTRTQPFAPITLALRQALPEADLAAVPDIWLREAARLLPELTERRPELAGAAQPLPEANQDRQLEGLARFLKTLPAPLTLCIEDLHWADAATLQLVGYLARRQGPFRQGPARALVVTCSPGDASVDVQHLLGELEREDRLRRIDLPALPATAVAELVHAATGAADPALAARLHAESQGQPFYAIELLRAWQRATEEGASPTAAPRLPLPRSIQGAIRRRLERLPAPARELATAAALFPGAVDFAVLTGRTGLAPAEAMGALEEALAAGVLTEADQPEEAPGSRAVMVGLSHPLLRRVILAELSAPRGQALRRQIDRPLAEEDAMPGFVGLNGRTPV